MNGCSKTLLYHTTKFSILFLLFLPCKDASAQQKQQLQTQKQYILQEIEESEKILLKKRKDKVGTENVLQSINKKVSARQTLIKKLQTETKNIQSQINSTTSNIQHLNTNIGILKKEYATMVRSAYKNRNDFSYWYFLFSSGDFNNLIKRFQYLRQYTDYRENQYQLLTDNIVKLEEDNNNNNNNNNK